MVSIIIPCYNAERWIAEAIESCLAQTYSETEIIVIDDGSTDGTLETAKSYGQKAEVITGSHRGGNNARNRGFKMSTGEFIQFLDADDYLLPEKLKSQVALLENIGADVAYGDWRHQHHRPNGAVELGEIAVTGAQQDILEGLLSAWWVPPCAVLVRRSAVERIEGWDESLKAAQDRDFMIRLALSGATFAYQPGCYAIYRRYGNVTVSTSNPPIWLESHWRVLEKAEQTLLMRGDLTPPYRRALALSYFSLARNYFARDRQTYHALMRKVRALDAAFEPKESAMYNRVQQIAGFSLTETLALWRRRLRRAPELSAAD